MSNSLGLGKVEFVLAFRFLLQNVKDAFELTMLTVTNIYIFNHRKETTRKLFVLQLTFNVSLRAFYKAIKVLKGR